jgi:hypothetical protein
MRRSRIVAEHDRSAACALNAGAAALCFSVLADSALEHYRGRFRNRTMYVPLAAAARALWNNTTAGGRTSRRGNEWEHLVTTAVGAVGLGFHAYNVLKRPGRLSWHNLFYAAPAGAPAALSIAGLLGLAADLADAEDTILDRDVLARLACVLSAAGIAGSAAEAWLLHFRGAFHNPAMLLPMTVPPVAAAMLLRDAIAATARGSTRAALTATAILGVGGTALHIWGVSRGMGGWRNWSQNLLSGPPLPAPPAFTALSIAAFGALRMMGR